MSVLNCLLCECEVDIIEKNGHSLRVKCKNCGFTSPPKVKKHQKPFEAEVTVIKKR